MNGGRPGFALIFSMLLIMALAVMALGILAVGTREARIAVAAARRTQAGYRAEAAAIHAFETWSTRTVAELPVGGVGNGVGGGTEMAATIERVDSALFLVRGTGTVGGPQGVVTTAAAGLLVRVLHPDRLAAAFPGALSATAPVTVADGAIVGAPEAPASCAEPAPGVLAPAVSIGAGASVTGDPPVRLAAPPTLAPDPFGAALAPQIASIRYTGLTASPRPLVVAGECVTDARNWGSPDPAHPCHSLLPVVLTGSLRVAGGVSRGVLIVDGDLTVTDGARLHGLVVVRGHLDLRDGSEIRGAVRAATAMIRDGKVHRDPCALADALSTPGLDRAFRPPSRWWVPAF